MSDRPTSFHGPYFCCKYDMRKYCTVSQKSRPLSLSSVDQILTDFHNFFTGALYGKSVIKQSLKIPPHLIRITTLYLVKYEFQNLYTDCSHTTANSEENVAMNLFSVKDVSCRYLFLIHIDEKLINDINCHKIKT